MVLGIAAILLSLATQARGHHHLRGCELAATPRHRPRGPVHVVCASKIGERQQCPADTSRGVVLARSYGEMACLLGKTWGYDDKGVWVADGCVADFIVATGAGVTPTPEAEEGRPAIRSERGVSDRRARERRDVRPALQLCALPESERPRRDLHRCVREGAHGARGARTRN